MILKFKLIGLAIFALGSWAHAEDTRQVNTVFGNISIQEDERKIQAQNFFETGVILYQQRKFEEAESYFDRALRRNPGHRQAMNYQVKVRTVLGKREDQISSQGEWLTLQKEVHEEEILVELDQKIQEAKSEYERIKQENINDPVELEDRLGASKSLFKECIELSRSLKSNLDARTYGIIIKAYLKELDDEIAQVSAEIGRRQRTEAKKIHVREISENERYVENRIRKLMRAVIQNIDQEKYTDAIKLSDDILAIDPLNGRIRMMRREAERLRHTKKEAAIIKTKSREAKRRHMGIKDSFIPYSDHVVYPEDWNFISMRQKKSLEHEKVPVWKTVMLQKMDQLYNYSCPGLPLQDVVEQLSELTGMNIVLDKKVLEENNEDDLMVRSFKFEGMKFAFILNWVVRRVKLAWILKDHVVYVTNADSVTDKMVLQLYDIQDLLAPKQTFVAPELSRGVGGAEDIDFEVAPDEDLGEVFSADKLINMIQDTIPGGNWENREIGVRIMDLSGMGSVLIKNTPDVHNQIIDLIETLRKSSSMQVEVQSRLLSIRKGYLREIGVNWQGLDSPEKLTISDQTQPGLLKREDNVNFIASIINGTISDSATSSLGFFMEHSILNKFQAKILLRALEQESNSTELISPRIVLVNNTNGYIRLARTRSFISGYNAGGSGLAPQIDEVDAGELLEVRATISSNRKYITLQVQPDFQEISFRDPVFIEAVGTATNGGDLKLPVDRPILIREQARTTAVIPDGGILIIGGVAESKESYQSGGVPFLSKIPFLGRLFRTDAQTDSSRDTMYIVSGRIIIFDEIESEL